MRKAWKPYTEAEADAIRLLIPTHTKKQIEEATGIPRHRIAAIAQRFNIVPLPGGGKKYG